MLAHDLLQKSQPVHARHLDVQRDHIGNLFADPVGRHKWIAGRTHDLDFRVGGEYFAQGLADHCGVVDNQEPEFSVRS